MIEEPRMPEQRESIKLTKNAKGEYQWEIKVIPKMIPGDVESNTLKDIDMKRLKNLDEQLNKKYGGKR